MLYAAYELQDRAGRPLRSASHLTARALSGLPGPLAGLPAVRHVRAACDVLSHAHPTYVRPAWGIDSVDVEGRPTEVIERPGLTTPFATLVHFEKPGVTDQPRVLVVGPLSGHFSTLLRPTVSTLLTGHDVHVLDWGNARDIPVEHGPFGLDEYIDHVVQALRHLGPDTHVVAVCQPAVPVLAAASLLAAGQDPAQPSTLTLIAGPVDTRINPGRINDRATSTPLASFERWLTDTVPARFAGAGRRVYPGAAQLTAFLLLDPRRHVVAHRRLYRALVTGDTAVAARTRAFYDEYGAVMDVPAEFYLETLQRIFMEHALARGTFTWRGGPVDPSAIRETALLTVEGAEDDMCRPGQTRAAHDLCTGIPAERRQHHLQAGVGHYGVFAGTRWEDEIYPRIRSFIAEHGRTPPS